MEKAIYTWGLIANGRRWSAPKTTWPFIPTRESALGRAGHAGFFTSEVQDLHFRVNDLGQIQGLQESEDVIQ